MALLTVFGGIIKCMKKVLITQGKMVIVDNEDYSFLNSKKWRLNNVEQRNYYAVREIWNKGKRYTEHMHRVVLERILGRKLKFREKTDHIDGNGLNNRRNNLRVCNQTQNLGNASKRKDNKSGHKGVYFDKSRKKFQVYINFDKKRYRLGRFSDFNEACNAYNKKAIELFGSFARLE